MAGDWIKMECCTPEKAEVLAITARMGWEDPDMTVGKLFRLWRWFDQHTIDGNAAGVTSALLDRIVGVSGFCDAMCSVGWLTVDATGIRLPSFDKHNGNTAKNRALTARRVAVHKSSAGREEANAKGNASTVSAPLPREEKRREEIHSEPKGSGVATPPDPADTIFALGVPLLTASNVADRNARSMLGLMRKTHGDAALIGALQRCADEKPLQPVAWLQAALKTAGPRAISKPDRIAEANIAVVRRFAERTAT